MPRERYKKGKRVDMRKGGRVALARGGGRRRQITPPPRKERVATTQPVTPVAQPPVQTRYGSEEADTGVPTQQPAAAPTAPVTQQPTVRVAPSPNIPPEMYPTSTTVPFRTDTTDMAQVVVRSPTAPVYSTPRETLSQIGQQVGSAFGKAVGKDVAPPPITYEADLPKAGGYEEYDPVTGTMKPSGSLGGYQAGASAPTDMETTIAVEGEMAAMPPPETTPADFRYMDRGTYGGTASSATKGKSAGATYAPGIESKQSFGQEQATLYGTGVGTAGAQARGEGWRSEASEIAGDPYAPVKTDLPPSQKWGATPNIAWENWGRSQQGLTTDVGGNPLPLSVDDWHRASLTVRSQVGRSPTTAEVNNYLYGISPERYPEGYVHDPNASFGQGDTETGGEDTGTDDDTGTTDDDATTSDAENLSRLKALGIIAGDPEAQGPQIPTPKEVEVGEGAGTMQMGAVQPVIPTPITTPTMATAAQTTAAQAQVPSTLAPATMEAAQVTPQVEVPSAAGAIGDEALAQAAEVEKIAPIEAVTIDIPEGALTERVVGTLSPNATAIAAQAAGTTLSKVTRAKKQLRNAGISEDIISSLGNNPEALEDRLMDLTQEERGVIGDLPEEAFVSNQLDSLLKGIENNEIPIWASPAVAAVEQMLAERGLEASTVGRDNLFNAIIQSAVPLAQANAQAIQQSVAQTRELESREELANVQLRQQTALQNANTVFQMDMAQFSADQQTALSNSKFLQTVSLTEASNRQQTVVQDATILSQMNLADADFYQKHQIQNAQSFLSMDMANLNNEQQSNILIAQQEQQRMLSNQAATNAAAQFNATSENQMQQFMTSLSAQIATTNVQQSNAMKQFNAQQENANTALRFQVEADLEKTNQALIADINKFNTQVDFNREQWNKQNAQAVEQSNVAWRRQANTIDTAAANQVSMQNAMNAFNLNSQSLSFLWQELRDQADQDFKSAENVKNREVQLLSTAMANEGDAGKTYDDALSKFLEGIIARGTV